MRLETFEMLDRVVARDSGRLVAAMRVPNSSPVFDGHFPGFALLPGVLMVEIMAQAAGWLVVAQGGFARMAVLAKVTDAKLRGMVRPGAELVATAELLHDGSGYAVLRGALDEGTSRAAEAEMTLRILPFPSPELEAALKSRARALGLLG